MTGLPPINFDYFNLAEIPTFTLCNPNKEKLFALGGISERKYSPRYNSLSELSFRADEYIDGILMPYYQYLTNRRLVYVDDVGYFMITEVTENNDGIVKYKEIGCQSLEVELSSRKLTSFVSGSGIWDGNTLISLEPIPLTLSQLYTEISPYLSGWTFDVVPPTLDTKHRTFDVSDTTLYNLLMGEVEEAYECIFDFDTVNDLIYIRDINDDIEITDIFISHDNLIKSMTVEEVTDGLATCLYVTGGGDLGINWVNPLANNYIYNFDYFKNTEWMNESLISAIMLWEDKFLSLSPSYSAYILQWLEDDDHYYTDATELNIISGSWLHDDLLYNTLIESGCPVSDPYMLELLNTIAELEAQITALEAHMLDTATSASGHYDDIVEIADSLKLTNTDNFTTEQQNQLQPFIIQSSYVNDNIILTDTMTSASILAQQTSLYNQAKGVLEKASAPRYSFEIDSVSFLQIKELEHFASQLGLGKKITLEIEKGRYLQPTLLGADIDFDNPTNFKLIFGNRLRLDDEGFQFNDLMGKALSAGTSLSINSVAFNNWTRDYKSDYLNLKTGVSVGGTAPAEGIVVSPTSINLKTQNLLWNDLPIAMASYYGGGGGTGTGSGITEIKIVLFSEGVSKAMYDPDEDGLDEAIDEAEEGDIIFMPDVDISGDFSIPTGVNLVGVSSQQSILRGQITIEPGSLLENLYIINEANSTSEIKAVVVQESTTTDTTCNIKGCEIRCYQCGTGTTHAVYIADSGVELVVENSTVIADSNGGLGYAFSSGSSADCRVYHSQYYAKTEVFHDI